jgi:hypothetical protein
MKVTVSRASARFDEYETELEIPQVLVKQLLNLGREIPVEENSGSWDAKGDGDSTSFIIDINPDTKEVELMIYDYYVE